MREFHWPVSHPRDRKQHEVTEGQIVGKACVRAPCKEVVEDEAGAI